MGGNLYDDQHNPSFVIIANSFDILRKDLFFFFLSHTIYHSNIQTPPDGFFFHVEKSRVEYIHPSIAPHPIIPPRPGFSFITPPPPPFLLN